MPEITELPPPTDIAATLAWSLGAAVAAYFAGVALSWALKLLGRRIDIVADIDAVMRQPIRATLVVAAATIAVRLTTDPAEGWRGGIDHALLLVLIATMTWLVASSVTLLERRAVLRFAGGDIEMTDADRHFRRIRTRATTLRRIGIAVVMLLGIAVALKTFPEFSGVGTTMFASAGVLSAIAGLAAQTSLGAAFAGMQIAFSDAVRVGDVVVLEDEWGRIEEITTTYVVVHLWDQRRLVLPTTYFTTTPFENWTRNATELMGTVEIDVDFSVPLDAMREELQRLLSRSELWDDRTGVLQVTDAAGGCVRVRVLLSAPNAEALFDLRCEIREGLVRWLHSSAPAALRQFRVSRAAAESSPTSTRDVGRSTKAAKPQAESALFSGGAAAELRGREFETASADPARPADRVNPL